MHYYDFDTKISADRSSSAKWREMLNHNSRLGAEIVPLSVADMEFRNPPEVIDALRDLTWQIGRASCRERV